MIKEPYIGMPLTMGNNSHCNGCQNNAETAPDVSFCNMHLGSLPIAMAYVPIQQWKTVYSLKDGLHRGTIFPELDLPFEGRGGEGRGGARR